MDQYKSKIRYECYGCHYMGEIEHLLFVFEEANACFIQNDEIEYLGKHICPSCGFEIYLKTPFGYFSAKYGVTIVTIHDDYDYNDYQRIIDLNFDLFGNSLSSAKYKIIKNKPFTFVQGWCGLKRFIKLLRGNPIDHFDEKKRTFPTSILLASGYSYDPLFFYYPQNLYFYKIYGAAYEISRHYKSIQKTAIALSLFNIINEILDWENPDVLKELGILCLTLNKREEARRYLQKANECQFRWLAPTLDFLDPTPRTRQDGLTQDPGLPHVPPISSRNNFTDATHALILISPAIKDEGMCFFPNLIKECAINHKPTRLQYEKICVELLGELLSIKEREMLTKAWSYVEDELYVHVIKPQYDSAAFWDYCANKAFKIQEYIRKYRICDFESRKELFRYLGEIQGRLQYEQVQILESEKNNNVRVHILKSAEIAVNRAFLELQSRLVKDLHTITSQEMLNGFYAAIKEMGGPEIIIEENKLCIINSPQTYNDFLT